MIINMKLLIKITHDIFEILEGLVYLAIISLFLHALLAGSIFAVDRLVEQKSRPVNMKVVSILDKDCNSFRNRYDLNAIVKCERAKIAATRNTREFRSSILVKPVRRR